MERNVPNVRQNLHVDRKFERLPADAISSLILSEYDLPNTPGVSKGVIPPHQLCHGCGTD